MNFNFLILLLASLLVGSCGLKNEPKIPEGDAIQTYQSEFMQQEDTKEKESN